MAPFAALAVFAMPPQIPGHLLAVYDLLGCWLICGVFCLSFFTALAVFAMPPQIPGQLLAVYDLLGLLACWWGRAIQFAATPSAARDCGVISADFKNLQTFIFTVCFKINVCKIFGRFTNRSDYFLPGSHTIIV